MEDHLSRLDALRFARRVFADHTARQLATIDQWIADEERRETERRQGDLTRPPAPDWLLEVGLNRDHAVYVHRGDCWNAGKRSRGVDEAGARQALADGVVACPHCRPDMV
ncbi:hypothetical protein SRB17_41520 [Streptomyces sp. RB17]|uniref:DUF6233 domain-containing protein n=1 Tax=Streptomyces sp. RB17 TaxID=2585197 RepID=UPI001297715F|nr:DUF6233 domain-containing protein [Streptomyces sp. RB17]MQY36155.1 hypothetical protein [Streptomyces sp. RB17]